MRPSASGRVEQASDLATDTRRLRWLTLRYWHHPATARALAGNPATPPMALRLLRSLGRWDVVAAVAANPRCPRGMHSGLASHPGFAVRAAIAANPAIRPAVLRRIVDRAGRAPHIALHAAANPTLDPAMAEALLRHSSPYVRAVAAACAAASPDALARLGAALRQPPWLPRAAAPHPPCPGGAAH